MTPIEIIDAADALVEPRHGGRVQGWPRVAAVLGRHAIEEALRQYWSLREPGLERCSGRAQLLCLTVYLRDRDLGPETFVAWSDLSRTCHHHAYELAPTAEELRSWLDVARRFTCEVARQIAAHRK